VGVRRLAGAEGGNWWEMRAREAGGVAPGLEGTRSLRSAGRPAGSGALLEAFQPLLARGEGGASRRWMAAHLLDGGLELRIPEAEVPGPGAAARKELEDAVRRAGGHLVVEGEPRRALDPVRARILDEIEAVFRPGAPSVSPGGTTASPGGTT
jgi:hypothetical protein